MNFKCPECDGVLSTVRGKRMRFYNFYDNKEHVGYELLRYRRCKVCKVSYALTGIKTFDGMLLGSPELTTEERYNSATDWAGYNIVGNTASEYTRRISQGPHCNIRFTFRHPSVSGHGPMKILNPEVLS